MRINLAQVQRLIQCTLEDSGLLTNITFERINEQLSGEVDKFFAERNKKTKVYDKFIVKGQIDENPRRNIYGPGGGEVQADLTVTFYGDQGYTPLWHDYISWDGERRYEVTGRERIFPHGNGLQIGWIVSAKRYN